MKQDGMKLALSFNLVALLAWGILAFAETPTVPLNGSTTFSTTSAPADTLKVDAGKRTIQATDAVKLQGSPNSRISHIATPGTGVVDVADVVFREGDSFYRVSGKYAEKGVLPPPPGGPVPVGKDGWVADYERGGARIAIEVNSQGSQDDVVVRDLDSATLTIRILAIPAENHNQKYTIGLVSTAIDDGVAFLKDGSVITSVELGKIGANWTDCVTIRLKGGSTTGQTTVTAADSAYQTSLKQDTKAVEIVGAVKIKLGQVVADSSAYAEDPGYFCSYIPSKWGGVFKPISTNGSATCLGDPNSAGWCTFKVTGSKDYKVGNTFVEEHTLSSEPWNSWWWPDDSGVGGPHMWDNPGPMSKYDSCYALTNAASALEWEVANRKVTQTPPSSGGHCAAATIAGFEEKHPKGNKNKNGVAFSAADCHGLMCQRWEYSLSATNWVFLVTKGDGTLKADWLHNKFRTQIANDVGGIILWWGSAHDDNWNAGIYKYSASYSAKGVTGGDEKKIDIVCTTSYKNWSGSPAQLGGTGSQVLKYTISYNDKGEVDAEIDWPASAGSVKKPERAMWHNKAGKPYNPKTSVANLEAIYH